MSLHHKTETLIIRFELKSVMFSCTGHDNDASHLATNSLLRHQMAAEAREKVMILETCLGKLFDSHQTSNYSNGRCKMSSSFDLIKIYI